MSKYNTQIIVLSATKGRATKKDLKKVRDILTNGIQFDIVVDKMYYESLSNDAVNKALEELKHITLSKEYTAFLVCPKQIADAVIYNKVLDIPFTEYQRKISFKIKVSDE